MKAVITIYFWSLVSIGVIITMIINTLLFLCNTQKIYHRKIIEIFISQMPVYMMELAGFWKIKWVNRNKDHNHKNNYVIVSNHTSIIDTIFTAQLPYRKIFTWNKKWAYTPGFGWLCYFADHIAIDKNNAESKRDAVTRSISELNQGTSVIFYPEGTRNRNQKENILLPFRTGAFRVAKESNTEILPITLIGTTKACNGFICDYAEIKIIINDSVKVVDIDDAVEKVRCLMISDLTTR